MGPPYDEYFNGAASRHAGSGVNAPLDKEGRTALHIAVERQDVKDLARLIRVGANPDQKNRNGQSAVYEAITRRRTEMLELLVEKGASLSITDDAGRTPLDWAIEQGCDADLVAKLKNLGAKTDPAPQTKRTPLHLAAQKGRADLVAFFVASGADINAEDSDGKTPLFLAVEAKNTPVVGKLIELGADPLRRDKDIRTPLHAAAALGYAEGVDALLAVPEVRRTLNDFQTYSQGFTPLMEAVSADRPLAAQKLVDAGANVNAKDHQGRNTLFIAVEQGAVDCARLLVAAGADVGKQGGVGYNKLSLVHAVNVKAFRPMLALLYRAGADMNALNNNGQTPLAVACELIEKEKVRALLELGANPDVPSAFGRRPLDTVMDHYGFAYSYGGTDHVEIIGLLLKAGANPDLSPSPEMKQSPMHMAARAGNLQVMKMLLQAHARIDQPCRDEAGMTPLHAAAEGGRADIVTFLAANGADKGRADNFGRTLLHFAARGGDEKLLGELLAEPGADIGKKDAKGRTPLHHAARKDKTGAARALLAAGADPNALDARGYTPLHLAMEVNYNPDVIRAFQEALGATFDCNVAAKDGDTPLHVAARNNQYYSMQTLVELGADPTKPGKGGLSALDVAVLNGSEWTLNPLLESMKKKGLSVDRNRDDEGRTSLHHAAGRDAGCTRRLIEEGADVNAVTTAGDTALHIAARAGRDDVARLLIEKGIDPAKPNAAGETALDAAKLSRNDRVAFLIEEEVTRRAQAKPSPNARIKPPQP